MSAVCVIGKTDYGSYGGTSTMVWHHNYILPAHSCWADSLYNQVTTIFSSQQGGGLNELQIAFVCRETLQVCEDYYYGDYATHLFLLHIQGLDYLHERNKMHRDIKGANILLTDNGDVKLGELCCFALCVHTNALCLQLILVLLPSWRKLWWKENLS